MYQQKIKKWAIAIILALIIVVYPAITATNGNICARTAKFLAP